MQENKFQSSIFLDNLREKLGFKRDTQLADFLGIAQPTVSGWRARNTFDFNLIAEKCIPLGISFDELLGIAKGANFTAQIEPKHIAKETLDLVIELRASQNVIVAALAELLSKSSGETAESALQRLNVLYKERLQKLDSELLVELLRRTVEEKNDS